MLICTIQLIYLSPSEVDRGETVTLEKRPLAKELPIIRVKTTISRFLSRYPIDARAEKKIHFSQQ